MKTKAIVDLLIIGGGINGAGIAADAAGRGLSITLCEQHDLASATSSASSKMIHGGLRYLEYYEFRLVREALAERDVILNIAPHITQPLSLVIPHHNALRPKWMIRMGLFLYDILGKRLGVKSKLHTSKILNLSKTGYGIPLKNKFKTGFMYSDCSVDDARLVILNAMSAKNNGAQIYTHTCFIGAKRQGHYWLAQLKTNHDEIIEITSRALVNAAGPWVNDVIKNKLHAKSEHRIKLVKGSHIVLPKLYEGTHAYLLQHDDKRVVFIIPYHDDFTMIGTTDLNYTGNPSTVTIEQSEIDYLCELVNQYFLTPIKADEILNTWSGVRPLQADDTDDPAAMTRDYSLEIQDENHKTPLLSIFGGKITTYRKLANQAMGKLLPYFPHMGANWTAGTPLPGGDIESPIVLAKQLQQAFPWLSLSLSTRYASQYGSLSYRLLEDATGLDDLGQDFGHQLFQREVDYLCQYEWAKSAEDILWRRTKLGLYFSAEQTEHLQNYLVKRLHQPSD